MTERRVLSRDERLGDALFTGLRLSECIGLAQVGRRYDVDVWGRCSEALRPFIEEGSLLRQGERLSLTRTGMLMANEVMAAFV